MPKYIFLWKPETIPKIFFQSKEQKWAFGTGQNLPYKEQNLPLINTLGEKQIFLDLQLQL